MAVTVEELQVLITAETKDLRAGLKELQRQIKRSTQDANIGAQQINKSISSIGKTVKTALAGVAAYFTFDAAKDAVTAFGQMDASLSNVQRTLGASAKTIIDWANNQAAGFNMAKDQAIVYSNTLSLLVTSFVKDHQVAADVTQNLLENAGVIASRTGRTVEDVLFRITSGLRGETEAIEDLGVFVHQSVLEQTNAFKQLANGKSWDQLDEFTKQQIRAYGILEQTMQKYGDTVNGGVSTAQQQLMLQLRNLKLELGAAFAPIALTVIPQLIKLIEYLRQATTWLATFTAHLFKVQKVDGAKSQNKALNDFNAGIAKGGNGLAEADKKAKKLKNTLAGFDEINKISFGTGEEEEQAIPTFDNKPYEMPPMETNAMVQSAQDAADKIKAIFDQIKPTWDNFFTPWKDAFIKYSPQMLSDLKRFGEAIGAILLSAGYAIDEVFKHGGYRRFVDGAVGAFAEFGGFLVDLFRATIAPLLVGFFDGFNPAKSPAMDALMTKLGDLAQTVMVVVKAIREHMQPVFEKLQPLFYLIGRIISGILVTAFTWIVDLLQGFFKALNPDNNPAMANFIERIGVLVDVITELVKAVGERLGPAFDSLSPLFEAIGNIVGNVLITAFTWVVELLISFFEKLNPNNNPAMAEFIDKVTIVGEKLMNLVSIIGEKLGPVFEALTPVFQFVGEILAVFVIETLQALIGVLEGVIDFLTGVFTGDWSLAWEGVKNIIINIFELIILKKLALVVKSIMKIFKPLTKFFDNLWTGIKNTKERIFGYFGGIASRAKEAVLSPFRSVGSWFGDIFNSAKGSVSNALGSFGGLARKAFEATTAPFKGIAKFFRIAFEGVGKAIKAQINTVIKGVNFMIEGLNKIKLPEALGGYSVNLPKIPKLARGGIVDRETTFIAGEAGKEVVMPLEHNTGWISQLAQKVASYMPQQGGQVAGAQGGSDRPLEVVLQIGQTKLGRVVVKSINALQKQEGKVLLDL